MAVSSEDISKMIEQAVAQAAEKRFVDPEILGHLTHRDYFRPRNEPSMRAIDLAELRAMTEKHKMMMEAITPSGTSAFFNPGVYIKDNIGTSVLPAEPKKALTDKPLTQIESDWI